MYSFSKDVVTSFVGAGAGTTFANITRGALSGNDATEHVVNASVDSYYLQSTLVLDMSGGEALGLAATTNIGIATAGIGVTADDFLVIGTELISLNGATIGQGIINNVTRAEASTIATEHNDGATVKYLKKYAGIGSVSEEIGTSATQVKINSSTTDLEQKVNTGGLLRLSGEGS